MGLDTTFIEAVRLTYNSIIFGHHILYHLLELRNWDLAFARLAVTPATIACEYLKTYEQVFDCMMFKRIVKGE